MATLDSKAVNGAPQTNGVHSPSLKAIPSHPKGSNSYAAKFDLPDHFIGGNRLEAAPPSAVKDFVADNDGHTVITKVGERSVTLGEKDQKALNGCSSRSSSPTTVLQP